MTDRMMIIIDIGGTLIAVALWLTGRYTVWKRRKQLEWLAKHPAE